jgi:hypothetical protein
MEKVPVVDLADDRTVQISTMDAGLREFGFFYVKNHNLDDEVRSQFEMAEALFDLPLGEKLAMPLDSRLDIGYVGPRGQNLDHVGGEGDDKKGGRSPGVVTDTKEQFMQTNNCLISAAGANPADAPIIDPLDVFAGSKNYTPSILDYSKVTESTTQRTLIRCPAVGYRHADTAGDPAIRGPETDEIHRRRTLRSRRCRHVRRRCTHGLGIVHDSRHGSNAGSADISQRSMVARPAQAGLPHRQ